MTASDEARSAALRHYVTYFDFNYLPAATVAVASFLNTQEFDRLTLVTPPARDGNPETKLVAQAVHALLAMDQRIEHIDTADVLGEAGEREMRTLLGSFRDTTAKLGHLHSDTLRTYLFPWCGHPLVYFDADILFVGDTSDLFRPQWTACGAAAPDEVSTEGDGRGLWFHQRFVKHVNERIPDAMRVRIPRNIGFIMLTTDVREMYREGLELARGFLETEHASGWFLAGQMAWNYAFERLGYETLPRRYNVPTNGPAALTAGDESAGEVLVRHYIGPHQKMLMFLDFLLLHSAEPRDGARSGGLSRNRRA